MFLGTGSIRYGGEKIFGDHVWGKASFRGRDVLAKGSYQVWFGP